MNDDDKRSIEVTVEIAAPPEAVWRALSEAAGLMNWFPPLASVSALGVGGEVCLSWGEGVEARARIVEWQPGRRITWLDESGWAGGPLLMDFRLESRGASTVLRFVHSGFAAGDQWDDPIEGVRAGWAWFFQQLRLYFAHHAGRVRQSIGVRLPFAGGREAAWKRITESAGGLILAGGAALSVDARCDVQLTVDLRTPAVVEVLVAGRVLGLRLPEAGHALLMIEIEPGSGEGLHAGFWLSSYDAEQAAAWRDPVLRRFEALMR